MSPASQKMCVVCGKNCAGSPRVKDPQGRYYCKPCYDDALERKKTSQAKVTQPQIDDDDFDFDDDVVIDDREVPDFERSLLDDEDDALEVEPPRRVKSGKPCPNCGEVLEAGAILCVNCGYNVKEGKVITPEIVGEESATPTSTKWPIVLAIISLLFAVPGAPLYALVSVTALLQSPADAGGAFAWAFNIVMFPILTILSIGLGVAAVALIMRKSIAPSWMRWWAIAKIIVSVAFAVGVMATGGAQFAATAEEGAPAEFVAAGAAILAIVVLFALAFFIAWPVFILLWFRREKIKAEVAQWK